MQFYKQFLFNTIFLTLTCFCVPLSASMSLSKPKVTPQECSTIYNKLHFRLRAKVLEFVGTLQMLFPTIKKEALRLPESDNRTTPCWLPAGIMVYKDEHSRVAFYDLQSGIHVTTQYVINKLEASVFDDHTVLIKVLGVSGGGLSPLLLLLRWEKNEIQTVAIKPCASPCPGFYESSIYRFAVCCDKKIATIHSIRGTQILDEQLREQKEKSDFQWESNALTLAALPNKKVALSQDGQIIIMDQETGICEQETLRGIPDHRHDNLQHLTLLSPNQLASASDRGVAKVWDIHTKECVAQLSAAEFLPLDRGCILIRQYDGQLDGAIPLVFHKGIGNNIFQDELLQQRYILDGAEQIKPFKNGFMQMIAGTVHCFTIELDKELTCAFAKLSFEDCQKFIALYKHLVHENLAPEQLSKRRREQIAQFPEKLQQFLLKPVRNIYKPRKYQKPESGWSCTIS